MLLWLLCYSEAEVHLTKDGQSHGPNTDSLLEIDGKWLQGKLATLSTGVPTYELWLR